MNPTNTDNEPMDAVLQGNNPKLQTVKYTNHLPEGKLGNYSQNERVDFKPDPSTSPYFDGKQSYLHIKVSNSSTWTTNAAADVSPPLCFPAHVGANALINRCVVRAVGNSQVIEDIEAYNQISGIKNSYSHDSDVFKTLSRISGVAGRTPCGANQTIGDLSTNYFLPNGVETGTRDLTGGTDDVSATFCVPIESGLFSAFNDEHHVVPNLDIPLHLQFFLEKSDIALQALWSNFIITSTVNGTAVVHRNAMNPFEDHTCTVAGNVVTLDTTTVCDTSLVFEGNRFTAKDCAFRIGFPLELEGGQILQITNVEVDQGGGDEIAITLDNAPVNQGATTCKLPACNRSYNISKIELKTLLTIPDQPTMRMIRSQIQKGISFTSLQLYKASTAEGLRNAVIEIPEALTRAKSIVALPCAQNNLESLDLNNSYIFPQPDSLVGTNDNNTTYQYQIQNTLLPNLAVATNSATNNQNDNSIYFNQVVMALRHLIKVSALSDNQQCRKVQDIDIELPFMYPLSLSPRGMSFNIIDSAPQLRINNTSTTPANILAKLYHIHVVHTRVLKATDMGASISF
tara:strand:+ start:3413 stop:5122 length:1710 start_codon:yes stop_codon:yes gene_type:complete